MIYYIRADAGSSAYHLDPECPILAQTAKSKQNHKGSKYLCIDESQLHGRVICLACGAPSMLKGVKHGQDRVREPA